MERFWSESFWLPQGVKWSELRRGDDIFLYIVPWVALSMLLLRPLIESRVAHVLGVYCSISDKTCTAPQHNAVLEKAYWLARVRCPKDDELMGLSEEVGWSTFKVHKWFWRARNHLKPSTLTKFKETFWRFSAYAVTSFFGFTVLVQERFFWDLTYCYRGYPLITPSQTVLLYWSLQFAFYISLLVSQFKDVKRKDFYVLFVHHLVTLCLLVISYSVNLVQMGVLILLIHDISDVPLELAKLFHYAGKQRLAEVTFAVFATTFFITRLVIFPFWFIRSTILDIPEFIGMFPVIRCGIVLLLTLQALHIYWFKLIVEMVIRLVKHGKAEGDARSDTDTSSCNEEAFKKKEQ